MQSYVTVRRHRKAARLAQRELAELLSITQGQVSRIEAGEPPTATHLVSLMIIFGAHPSQLFGRYWTDVGEEVLRRAAELERKLGGNTRNAQRKRAFLRDIIGRVAVTPA